MQIKFDNTTYDLKDHINVDATRLQATIIKEEYTVDEIVEVVESATTIRVYNDEGELIGQYEGYDKPIAYTLYTLEDDIPVVSVELRNTDYEAALNTLQTTVNSHTQSITSLDSGVADLAVEVADLNESQLSQDAAIEDLAEIMAEVQ